MTDLHLDAYGMLLLEHLYEAFKDFTCTSNATEGEYGFSDEFTSEWMDRKLDYGTAMEDFIRYLILIGSPDVPLMPIESWQIRSASMPGPLPFSLIQSLYPIALRYLVICQQHKMGGDA